MTYKIKKSTLTMLGVGKVKYFPGTTASFITCIIFYLLWLIFGIKNLAIPYIFFLILTTFFSVIFINQLYGKNDDREIVIDEFIGQNIPLLSIYNTDLNAKLFNFLLETPFHQYFIETWILMSFILFRFFDILKPFPINLIDKKIKNGFGVIADDVIAGIFTTIFIYICLLWI